MSEKNINPSDPDIGQCWARAFRCPSKTTDETTGISRNQTICEAWYRCDGFSNYDIRWRCQGVATSASLNSAIGKCSNSSLTVDKALCPPPVVCPSTNGMSGDATLMVTKDNVIDVDIVLALALAVFALLALTLMAVASYKYWRTRKKYHRRFHLKVAHFRAFTSPTSRVPGWYSYKGLGHSSPSKAIGHAGTVQGLPYSNVYFPYQLSYQPRQLHQTDGSNYWTLYKTRKQSKVKRLGKSSKNGGGTSVPTGSFIYQPNIALRDTRGCNIDRGTRISPFRAANHPFSHTNARLWTISSNLHESQTDRNPPHPSTTQHGIPHRFGGTNFTSGNPNPPLRYVVQPPTPESSSDEYKINSNTNHPVSSIQIPSFDNTNKGNNLRTPVQDYPSTPLPNSIRSSHVHKAFRYQEGNDPGDVWNNNCSDSDSSISPYATGRVHYTGGVSEASTIASKNWQYTVFCQKANIHTSAEMGTVSVTAKDNATTVEHIPNSPDVISSHNLSKHVTHISQGSPYGEDTYLERKGIARINVPNFEDDYYSNIDIVGGDEFKSQSENTGNKPWAYSANSSCDIGSENSMIEINQELSYDSFRNEHLRQVSKHGAVATSSTLDKGVGQMRTTTFHDFPYHF